MGRTLKSDPAIDPSIGGSWFERSSVLVWIVLFLVLGKLVIFTLNGAVNGDWSWIGAFHRWDSFWYDRIISSGYPAGPIQDGTQVTWAFFPGYPMLVKFLGALLMIPSTTVMEIISFPLYLASALAMYLLAKHEQGEHAAKFSMLFLLCFPFSVVLFMHYSDAMYLALLLAGFLAIAKRAWWWAALAFACLVMVRPNALFVFPAAWLYAVSHGNDLQRDRVRIADIGMRTMVFLPASILFALYCAYQWRATGEPFAFSIAQTGWNRRLDWPWTGFFRTGDAATQFESWYALGSIIVLIGIWRKLIIPYRVLLLFGILIPLCSGSVDSITRFSLAFFPIMFIVGNALAQMERAYIVLLGVFLAQVFCMYLWVVGHPLMA